MNKYLSILLFFISITCSAQVHIIYNLVDSVGGGSGGGSGTLTSLQYINPSEGLLITGTNPATTAATWTFSLANDLAAFEALSGTGIPVRTGLNTWAQRTLVQGANILITNPDGVSGNITIAAGDSQSLSIVGNQLTISRGNTITLPSGGGSGTTDLSLNGTSTIDTLRSSTGTDVVFQTGSNITFDISTPNKLIINSTPYTSGLGISIAGNVITNTDPDQSITNELQTLSFNAGTGQLTISSGNTVTITAGGGSATDLTFSGIYPVTLNSSSGADVTFTAGSGINFSSSVGNLSISAVDNSATNEIQSITWGSIVAGGPGSGSATASLSLGGGTISLVPGSNVTFANSGGSLQINSSTGALSGSGTTNFISKWTSSTNLSNSTIQDNGSTIGMNGATPVAGIMTQWPSGDIRIGINAGTTNRLLFGDGSFVYIGEESSDDRMVIHAGTLMFNLTSGGGTGTSGQVLTSNGTTASWQTPTGGTAPLSFTSITSGSATLSAGSTTVSFSAGTNVSFANSAGALQISSTGGGGGGTMSLSGGLIFSILGVTGSMGFQSANSGLTIVNTGSSTTSNLLFTVADVSATNEIQSLGWGSITSGSASQTISLGGTGNTIVAGSNITFANVAGNLQINANLAGGAVSGSGTTNFLSKWSGASSLVNSLISDNGTNIFLTSLTSNGYVKTSGGTGSLSVSTTVPGSDVSGNISGNAASITGSITESQVTSLVSDLASKQSVITTGSTLQYFRGDLSLATFPTTTASFANSTNKNFVTDAQLTVINGISGTNTGDQTITLPSDVTGSGTGTFATTIAAGAVTLAKMANVATGTLFYRRSLGTGGVELNTLAQLKTDLGLTGTNSGDQVIGLTNSQSGSNIILTPSGGGSSVQLNAGTGIQLTNINPSTFQIVNTLPGVTYTPGTGISIVSGVITNTSPNANHSISTFGSSNPTISISGITGTIQFGGNNGITVDNFGTSTDPFVVIGLPIGYGTMINGLPVYSYGTFIATSANPISYSSSTTISTTAQLITATTSGITLTLPAQAQGKTYYILNTSGAAISIGNLSFGSSTLNANQACYVILFGSGWARIS
jgi:hypothetical protein